MKDKITFKEDLKYCLNLIEKQFFKKKIIIEIERIEGLVYYKIYLYKPHTKQLKFSEGHISNEELSDNKINNTDIEFTIFNFLKYNNRNFYKKFELDVL